MHLRIGIAGLFLILGMWPVWSQNLYRLEVNDRIEIWTSAEPSLQRTAIIGPDGWLSLPLLGHVRAEGLTAPELEQLMQEKLKSFFKETIDLTVMLQPREERAQNIYVTGQVATPGAYAFRPGMIVLHGISMAGGLRTAVTGTDEQRIVEIRGSIAYDSNRINAVDAQIARVLAELTGGELGDDGLNSLSIERERQILAARRNEEAVLLKARNDALQLRRTTIETISQQGTTHATRIELAGKRLNAIQQLVKKGFANEAQLFELQGNLAELQAQELRHRVELLNSQREIGAEIAGVETALQARRTQLQMESRDVQREREEIVARRADRMRILEILVSDETADTEDPVQAPTFSIVRSIDGRPVEVDATEFSEIQSGDLISVGSSRQTTAEQQVSTREAPRAKSLGAVLQ